MMIDINKPVKQGYDMILNYKDGEQKLGSAGGYDREANDDKLLGLPPNDNPNGDVNPPDSYENHVMNVSDLYSNPDPRPKRAANGRFA